MTQVLRIGPFVLPLQLLVVLFAITVALLAGRWAGNRRGADVETIMLRVVVVALVAARLAFVWQFREAYFKTPIDILDIRDGGWSAEGGMIVGWLYALSAVRNSSSRRKPVVLAMFAASTVLVAGSMMLLFAPTTRATLPPQQLAALDGSPLVLTSFVGRPTVVNLWATWCPPCQREMPVLQQAQREKPELNVVFVNQGEASAAVSQYLQRGQLALRNVVLDPKGTTGTRFNQTALPTTLFFDAKGRLVGTRVGELSRATLEQRLLGLSARQEPR